MLAALLGGCAGPLGALKLEKPLQVERQKLVLKHDGTLPDDVRRVEDAVQRAIPRLAAWGGLVEPVTVFVVNDHETLEDAVHRRGYAWLRAWGRYDEIILQAPSTWTMRDAPLEQLVLHELSHCLLFQRSATRKDWIKKNIPLWFREGMAIAIAEQANQYPSLEDSAAWLMKNPTLDPFADGEALSQDFGPEVYGVGYHAFSFLDRRLGRDRIITLMATMREGADFETAFTRAFGVSVQAFQRDFENYLKFRAFRFDKRQRIQRPPLRELLERQRPASGTTDTVGQGT